MLFFLLSKKRVNFYHYEIKRSGASVSSIANISFEVQTLNLAQIDGE